MPAPIPTMVPSLLPYQFHQVAIFTHDANSAVEQYKQLGYTDWIEDNAELKGVLYGEPVVTKAKMLFNYDIMPMELEFLEYTGPSRHSDRSYDYPFISHMSTYVDDVVSVTEKFAAVLGKNPFHRFITQNHSNENVIGKKRFIESIFDTRDLFGYDFKLIQKVAWGYEDAQWLDYQPRDLR